MVLLILLHGHLPLLWRDGHVIDLIQYFSPETKNSRWNYICLNLSCPNFIIIGLHYYNLLGIVLNNALCNYWPGLHQELIKREGMQLP